MEKLIEVVHAIYMMIYCMQTGKFLVDVLGAWVYRLVSRFFTQFQTCLVTKIGNLNKYFINNISFFGIDIKGCYEKFTFNLLFIGTRVHLIFYQELHSFDSNNHKNISLPHAC